MFGFATAASGVPAPYQQPARPLDTGPRRQRYADVVALPTRTVSAPVIHGERHRSTELHLLGGFRLLLGGELAHIGRMGERLLAVLACRGRPAARSKIAHALWPDTTSDRAHANLRNVLYRLYRRAPGTVHATTAYLQLSVGMRVDLEHSTLLARQILSCEAAAGGP